MGGHIPFFKMSACGNDFCIIDNRLGIFPEPHRDAVANICKRRIALGADGLILIEKADSDDTAFAFRMRFYNADGGEVEMCGNGARCVARYAYLNNIAPEEMTFQTNAGPVKAKVTQRGIKIGMGDVGFSNDSSRVLLSDVLLNRRAYFITVGVPHVIYVLDDSDVLEEIAVDVLGRKTRCHEAFKPKGTNADFIKITGQHSLAIRTYERGVEDVTLACGTGSTAAAIVAESLGLVAPPVEVITESGCPLWIDFKKEESIYKGIWLEGEARVVCSGEIWLDEIRPSVCCTK